MSDKQIVGPDNTAIRVALWRALHVEADAPPHVFEDVIGLKLARLPQLSTQVLAPQCAEGGSFHYISRRVYFSG